VKSEEDPTPVFADTKEHIALILGLNMKGVLRLSREINAFNGIGEDAKKKETIRLRPAHLNSLTFRLAEKLHMIRGEMLSRMSAAEFANWVTLAELDYEHQQNPDAPLSHYSGSDQLVLMDQIGATREMKAARAAATKR